MKQRGTKRRVRTDKRTGYKCIDGTGHPLAWGRVGLTVGVHRIVLWQKIGPGEHKCHWCGCAVVWAPTKVMLPDGHRRLIADHVDGVRWNNAPENLVPACNPCNTLRSTPMAGRKRKAYVSRHRGASELYDAPTGTSIGPLIRVVRELPYDAGVGPQGTHIVRYVLECGHAVSRRGRGKTMCYCDQCPGAESQVRTSIRAYLTAHPGAHVPAIAKAAYGSDAKKAAVKARSVLWHMEHVGLVARRGDGWMLA